MKVPLSWLKEYVDVVLPLSELATRLTMAGLEVTGTTTIGAEWDRDKIVVGQLIDVKRHPDADRLLIAVVDHGMSDPQTVVTGAPNIKVGDCGLKVAFARTGARLIDGHADDGRYITLKPIKLRGVQSAGMVCSEKELGLSDEHEGIILLDDEAPVGMALQDYMGDTVLELEPTPNMGRCLSVIGVAREVAALTGQRLRLSEPTMLAEGPAIDGQVTIEIADPDLCPRYSATLIRGIKVGPSPYWMQLRLRAAGMRPINNIVDTTNYVMLEWGQPLHAFDYDRLLGRDPGDRPVIIVRRAMSGEQMTTLDGVERNLSQDMLLITDGGGPIALAGIMGGLESEIDNNTTNVLLEAANFNNINNRRTSQALRLPSEASLRFGRGVPPETTVLAATRATERMRRLAGGVVASGIADAYPVPKPPQTVELPASEVERLLGVKVSRQQVIESLESLGFSCAKANGEGSPVHVTVPYYRLDVSIPADLVEEVARIIGYDGIPATLLREELPPQHRNLALEGEDKVRDVMVSCGLTEVISYSLTSLESVTKLDPRRLPVDGSAYIRLANPLSGDREYMRQTLCPSLLDTLRDNLRFTNRVLAFETGRVYLPQPGAELPDEPRRLGIVMSGPRDGVTWTGGNTEPLGFFDLKGVVETLLDRLHIQDRQYRPTTHPTYQVGRVARVSIGESDVGVIGEVHPMVREAFDLPEQRVCLAELDLDLLLSHAPATYLYQAPSRFPAVSRDLALVVDEDIPAARVGETIIRSAGQLLQTVELFDVYRGPPIPGDKKSLAYSLSFQSEDRTLTDEEVNKLLVRLQASLQDELGAVLRA